jgi:hypothetical protein
MAYPDKLLFYLYILQENRIYSQLPIGDWRQLA